jgi:hypothetical protein
MRLLDTTANVVADDLAQHFIDHGDIGLASNGTTELRLDHRERRLDVAPLVIVLQEFITIELPIVIHPLPQPSATSGVDALECGGCPFCERDARDSFKAEPPPDR